MLALIIYYTKSIHLFIYIIVCIYKSYILALYYKLFVCLYISVSYYILTALYLLINQFILYFIYNYSLYHSACFFLNLNYYILQLKLYFIIKKFFALTFQVSPSSLHFRCFTVSLMNNLSFWNFDDWFKKKFYLHLLIEITWLERNHFGHS